MAAGEVSAAEAEVFDLLRVFRADPERQEPIVELFSGGIGSGTSWFAWAGAVASLSGGLYDSGWRMRVLGGYGHYGFESSGFRNGASPMLFEVTPGYQFRKGPLFAKLFAGVQVEQHRFDVPDPGNRATSTGVGAKFISENWLDLPLQSAASLDLSYATRGDAVQARLRGGTSYIWPQLQLGGEAGFVGDTLAGRLRIGGFTRTRWERQK